MSNLNNIFSSLSKWFRESHVVKKEREMCIHPVQNEPLVLLYNNKIRNIYNIYRDFPPFAFVRNMKARERERERKRRSEDVGCSKTLNPSRHPQAIPKEEPDLRARDLKSGYLRY